MNNLHNLGIIEIMDLSHMGKMSYNRAKRIRRDVYGGRPWRFLNDKEIGYLRRLWEEYNVSLLNSNFYYWSSHGVYQSSTFIFNVSNYHSYSVNNSSSGGYLVLVRTL